RQPERPVPALASILAPLNAAVVRHPDRSADELLQDGALVERRIDAGRRLERDLEIRSEGDPVRIDVHEVLAAQDVPGRDVAAVEPMPGIRSRRYTRGDVHV